MTIWIICNFTCICVSIHSFNSLIGTEVNFMLFIVGLLERDFRNIWCQKVDNFIKTSIGKSPLSWVGIRGVFKVIAWFVVNSMNSSIHVFYNFCIRFSSNLVDSFNSIRKCGDYLFINDIFKYFVLWILSQNIYIIINSKFC